ncbi:Armadillo repeat-containing protein 1 [Branchiostoma belcheri]|nr:Armadillo repeat-containing protein 1 [Branchiostoma belcheri]
MTSTEGKLQVVRQLHDIARQPQGHDVITQDPSLLSGLVLFLDVQQHEETVVCASLEVLELLAHKPSCRPIMHQQLGMKESLQHICSRNTAAQASAQSIFQLLYNPQQKSRTPGSGLKDTYNSTRSATNNNTNVRKKVCFLGAANKKSKTITLQIKGLTDQHRRELCVSQLLKVKGVISFTFNMPNQRCILRARQDLKAEQLLPSNKTGVRNQLPSNLLNQRCILRARQDLKAEALVAMVNQTGVMSAQQVVRNDAGEEVLLSFGAHPADANKENTALPDYLPEEDSPVKSDGFTLARSGHDPQGGGRGWLSSAAGAAVSYLSKSFYW